MLNELQHLRPLNAGDRNRTGTVSLQQDFKSCASASSATAACYEHLTRTSVVPFEFSAIRT